jgi:hypothetical protein
VLVIGGLLLVAAIVYVVQYSGQPAIHFSLLNVVLRDSCGGEPCAADLPV